MTKEAKQTSKSAPKGAASVDDIVRQMDTLGAIGSRIGTWIKKDALTGLALLSLYAPMLPQQMQQLYGMQAQAELQRQEARTEALYGAHLPQAAQQPYGLMPAPQYAPHGGQSSKH